MNPSDTTTPFTLARRFPHPLDAVWKAWSDPGRLARWWGPKGCTVELLNFDFRAGGHAHYAMDFPAVPRSWGRFAYREIVPRERLVWLNSFANARGGIARAPFAETCPLEIENRVVFQEEAGATLVSLQAVPFGAVDAELRFFDALQPSLQQGYGGTFDQLGEHLRAG